MSSGVFSALAIPRASNLLGMPSKGSRSSSISGSFAAFGLTRA
ncbi:unnamed protein product [Chondrus crispus]|uniref:Uncharacterized protein n=1 Tax=Chondrus crispus TaxID=2769 RepID=R7Q4T1_CHOCR|nr:unnamed protein product [Chondrus crispus]CDF32878.1 unnamed protein product [Chondrus crispus]|eukprot:XP_005712679.1 unnamed protein product [Chondrus crispus]